jgi:uncharacterized membrane protein YkoI
MIKGIIISPNTQNKFKIEVLNMNKKIIGLVITVIIAIVAVSGCIGSTDNSNETNNSSKYDPADYITEEKAISVAEKEAGESFKTTEVILDDEYNGKTVYKVMYVNYNNLIGVIVIDAITGEVIDSN